MPSLFTRKGVNVISESAVAFKLEALRAAFTPQMAKIAEEARLRDREEGDADAEIQAFQEAKSKGVNVETLKDIRAVFNFVDEKTGRKGIEEAEFIRTFGVHLCKGMSHEEISVWFRGVDKDCSGRLTWDEIATFLSTYSEDVKAAANSGSIDTNAEKSKCFGERCRLGAAALHRSHTQLITHILSVPGSGACFSGSSDGVVRAWNVESMKSSAVPVHACQSWITGLVQIPAANRIAVLESDRCIFIYDVATKMNAGFASTALHRAYGSIGLNVNVTGSNTSVYRRPSLRRVVMGDSPEGLTAPVTLLHNNRGEPMTAMAHLGTLSAGENMLVGTSLGYVESYYLRQSDDPILPTSKHRTHKDWVTQLTIADELEGYLSSSTDGTVKLTSLEKTGVVLQSYKVESVPTKPVNGFCYTREGNMLAIPSGRSVVVWNALTGVRHMILPPFDRTVVRAELNHRNNHLYTLTDNKVVKVWDTRSWRVLETLTDPHPHFPEDVLSVLLWLPEHSMLLSGANELVSWRTVDIQEKLDAGLGVAQRSFIGHFQRVTGILLAVNSKHIIGIDTSRAIVWSALTYAFLWSWKVPFRGSVTASFVEKGELKVLIGTDEGDVAWVNYSCGHVCNRLMHKHKGEVGCVEHFEKFTSSASCTVATLHTTIMLWYDDVRSAVSHDEPDAETKLPDEDGIILSMGRAGLDQAVVAVGTTTGTIIIMNLTTLSSVLRIPPGALCSAESIHVQCPGFFSVGYSNGTTRMFAFERDTCVIALARFTASARKGDTVTCTATVPSKGYAVYGDSGGYVSIFKINKLLNVNDVRNRIVPMRTALTCTEDALTSSYVSVVAAWMAHREAITGVIYVECSNILITSSSDTRIRAWSFPNHELLQDFGRDASSIPQEVAYIKLHAVKHQFTCDSGTGTNDSAQGADETMAILANTTQQQQTAPTPVTGSATPSSIAGEIRRPVVVSNLSSALFGSPSEARVARGSSGDAVPDRSLVAELSQEATQALFELATRRVCDLRSGLSAAVPPRVSSVRAQLSEVSRLRDRRSDETLLGEDDSQNERLAFSALVLPSVRNVEDVKKLRRVVTPTKAEKVRPSANAARAARRSLSLPPLLPSIVVARADSRSPTVTPTPSGVVTVDVASSRSSTSPSP